MKQEKNLTVISKWLKNRKRPSYLWPWEGREDDGARIGFEEEEAQYFRTRLLLSHILVLLNFNLIVDIFLLFKFTWWYATLLELSTFLNDVVECYLELLNNRLSLAPLNETMIVLIPKVDLPRKISEFRLISLFNVCYKVISKAIVNRMKGLLNSII